MRRLLLCLCVAACGGIDSHEAGLAEKRRLVDEYVALLGTVRDRESAEAARPELAALQARMDEVEARLVELGPMAEKVAARRVEDSQEAMRRILGAMQALPPEARAALGLGG